ncbi:hypothetical protein Acr_09g0008310 [Actinidia rufa]|uniref:Uncharacterized protein n=1 Tax=Actinidia rufa TaxID=165716 RepID=A0A7J0F6S0_9ERIC|nr:hypothetical protein Acr_09g0008310 [Actinidia rufa]
MDLNRTQLMVHDDNAFNKFKIDHGIPDDVQIKKPEPNENADTIEGNGNQILEAGNSEPEMIAFFHSPGTGVFFQIGRAPPRRLLSSKELSAELDEGAAIVKEHDSSEGAASSSSSSGLTSDNEEEIPQLVRRKRGVATPVLLLSSDSDDSDDLGSNRPQSAGKDEIEHSYTRDSAATLSSGKVHMGSKFKKNCQKKAPSSTYSLPNRAELWRPEFSIAELGKRVTMVDIAKDHDTSLALARAVLLPNDIVDLSAEGLEETRDLQVACGPMYERVFNWGISRAGDNYDRQVAELRPDIYQEGWIACLIELGISAKEYMNQLAEKDAAIAPKINPAGNGNGLRDVAAIEIDGDGDESLWEGLEMPI